MDNDMVGATIGQDVMSVELRQLLDDWSRRWDTQQENYRQYYMDYRRISRDGDTKGTGAAQARKAKPLFVGSTRSKIRSARARIKDTLFGQGGFPLDTSPTKEEMKDYSDLFERILVKQLEDMEYKAELGTGVGSLGVYGTAYTFGPFVRERTIKDVNRNKLAENSYEIEEEKYVYDEPYYETGRTMDVYPDPDSKNEQDGRGLFWYTRMTVEDAKRLKNQDGYRNIDEAIKFKEAQLENKGTELNEYDRGNIEYFTQDNRIALIRFFGLIPQSYLDAWEDGEEPLLRADLNGEEDMVESVVITLGGIVVKAYKAVHETRGEVYRPVNRCVYEEDEGEIVGVGIAENNEAHQRVTNAAFRLYMEGKGYALLGMFALDRSKFAPGEDGRLYAGKTWQFVDGLTQEEQKSAIQQFTFNDVTQGWENVIGLSEKFSDDDTGISKYTQGQDASHLNNTATGISMIMSASVLPLKEVMQNIDKMWIDKHITKLIDWDMEYLETETVRRWFGDEEAQFWSEIKDFGKTSFMTWKPTGTSTFIAREILMQKLQGYLSIVSSNDRLAEKVDERELLEQIWDAAEVGKESPVYDEETLKKMAMERSQSDPAQQLQIEALNKDLEKKDAEIKELQSKTVREEEKVSQSGEKIDHDYTVALAQLASNIEKGEYQEAQELIASIRGN